MPETINDKKDIKDFYDNVYRSGDIRDSRRLYRWVMGLINPAPDTYLLDVGCGIGCLFYEARDKKINPVGLDISAQALAKARQNLVGVKLCVADGEVIPFKDNLFDNVVSLGSIEHFLSPENGLIQMKRVLKNKGRLFLILPNSFSLENILKVLLKGRTDEQWQIQEKLLTREEWQQLLENNGFIVEKVYGYNKYPEFFQEGTIKIKSIRKFFNRFFMKHLCPLNLSWEFLYVCRKG